VQRLDHTITTGLVSIRHGDDIFLAVQRRLASGVTVSALILCALSCAAALSSASLARERTGRPTGAQIHKQALTRAQIHKQALTRAQIHKHGPTRAQIGRAINRARRSPNLWATVDICNTPRHPDVIGIRGQMPSLGFTATLYMSFQVDYYSIKAHRFEPDPGVQKRIFVARGAHGSHQGGVTFRIQPPAILSGTVTFEYQRAGRVLGRAVRATTHGQHHVEFADPPGYSTATCRFG